MGYQKTKATGYSGLIKMEKELDFIEVPAQLHSLVCKHQANGQFTILESEVDNRLLKPWTLPLAYIAIQIVMIIKFQELMISYITLFN